MKHNVLIVSFHFPPSPAIGARRWSKFVKYLSASGIKLTVVSDKGNKHKVVSPYSKDIKDAEFTHVVLNSRYPGQLQNMQFKKSSLWTKISFRLVLYYVQLFSKGNFYDYTIFWRRYFRTVIPQLIREHEINRVILTGPPFRHALYALELKKISNVELILDCRDLWWDTKHIPPISRKRQEFEIRAEEEVVCGVDKILSISDFQKSILTTRYPNHAPVFVLRNGFDKDDIPRDIKPKRATPAEIRFVHLGVMHADKRYYWIPFVKALAMLKAKNPVLFDKLVFDFVGICPDEVAEEFQRVGARINLLGFVDLGQSYHYLNQADIVLWFKYDSAPGDFATKFGDYISLKKYMWVFSLKGDVTEHVEQNGIGTVFYREDGALEESIYAELIQLEDSGRRCFNPSYDSSALDIEFLTKRLVKILYPD